MGEGGLYFKPSVLLSLLCNLDSFRVVPKITVLPMCVGGSC